MKLNYFTLYLTLCIIPFSVAIRRQNGKVVVRPPSFQRTPTMIDCADGSSRPLNSSTADMDAIRSRCPSAVLEFRETLPHCPDLSFCPQEFRAISPCGDCCSVCREPNEEFMASSKGVSSRNSSDNDPCLGFKCKRLQRCVKNIQGLPVCRCFPVEMCSKPGPLKGKKKDKRNKEICGNDGNSYESRCHLQVAACQKNAHIRMAHKGACMKPAVSSSSEAEKVKSKRPNNRRQNKQASARLVTTAVPRVVMKQSDVSNPIVPSRSNSRVIAPSSATWGRTEGKAGVPDYVAVGRERDRTRKVKKGKKGTRKERFKLDRPERTRITKIERLERKKMKLERRLLREKERANSRRIKDPSF